MLINSQLVKDFFGQYYKIQTSRDKPAPDALQQERFHSSEQARRFIKNLTAPLSFWAKIYHAESLVSESIQNNQQLLSGIAELLSRGKIKAFKIDIPSLTEHPPEKRTLTDASKNRHTFTAASSLLISSPKEVKSFADKAEAEKYLSELSADEAQLKEMAQELDLPVADLGVSAISGLLADALVSGSVVVIVDRYSAPPKAEQPDDNTVHVDKDAGAGPINAAAPVKKDICNCTISTLEVVCSHGRSQSSRGILQIVPSPDRTRMEEYELMGNKVTLKEEYAGEDELNCSLGLQNNKGSGCYYITDETRQIVNSESSKIIIEGENSQKLEKWPINAQPETISIQGHGCDKAGKTVRVESYPSQYYTVQADLSIFKVWADKVNEGWEAWGKNIFSLSPVQLSPKITPPTGSFSANWGWKENQDWRTYYNISSDFGLNPILGIEIKIVLSMAALGLTAAGIPPNLANLAAEHLLDIQLSAAANCKAALIGQPAGKFYSDGSKEITGEARFTSEGGVVLELLARAGSDYVVSVSLSISGEAKVTGDDVVSLDKTGLYLQSNIMLTPFIGVAKATIRYFKIRSKTKSKKWEPWSKIELYKSENKKLLPR